MPTLTRQGTGASASPACAQRRVRRGGRPRFCVGAAAQRGVGAAALPLVPMVRWGWPPSWGQRRLPLPLVPMVRWRRPPLLRLRTAAGVGAAAPPQMPTLARKGTGASASTGSAQRGVGAAAPTAFARARWGRGGCPYRFRPRMAR
eukprot:14015823-Alexandrium_andersonii.AAC.1